MKLTDRDLREFKELYRTKLGIELTDEEALDKATKLIRLMQLVYQPITRAEHEKYCGQDHSNASPPNGDNRL